MRTILILGRKEYNHKYYLEHKAEIAIKYKQRYIPRPPRKKNCLICNEEFQNSKGRKTCSKKCWLKLKSLRYKKRTDNEKMEVFYHYSFGTMTCIYCKEKRIECLELDHVNNNGAYERKHLFPLAKVKGGKVFYHILLKRGLPEGYQVLCSNCNQYKQYHPDWRGED